MPSTLSFRVVSTRALLSCGRRRDCWESDGRPRRYRPATFPWGVRNSRERFCAVDGHGRNGVFTVDDRTVICDSVVRVGDRRFHDDGVVSPSIRTRAAIECEFFPWYLFPHRSRGKNGRHERDAFRPRGRLPLLLGHRPRMCAYGTVVERFVVDVRFGCRFVLVLVFGFTVASSGGRIDGRSRGDHGGDLSRSL